MADHELPPLYPISPRRGDEERMVTFVNMIRGGVVFDAGLAIKFAEVLCAAHYGEEEVARQRPFTAEDKGTFWRVEGSCNRDGKEDPLSSFFYLSIDKYDGRVTDIGQWATLKPDPRAMEILKASLPNKKPDSDAKE